MKTKRNLINRFVMMMVMALSAVGVKATNYISEVYVCNHSEFDNSYKLVFISETYFGG